MNNIVQNKTECALTSLEKPPGDDNELMAAVTAYSCAAGDEATFWARDSTLSLSHAGVSSVALP